MATRDPFTSGLSFGSALVGSAIEKREAREAKKEEERLIDIAAVISQAHGPDVALFEFDRDGRTIPGKNFYANTPIVNEIRNRLINLSPAFEETLKYDGGKPGEYAGEVQLENGNSVLLNNTNTPSGIQPVTQNRSSNSEDPVLEVPRNSGAEMAQLAINDLHLEVDPTYLDRILLAQNVKGTPNLEELQKEILTKLRDPQTTDEERMFLLSTYLEETNKTETGGTETGGTETMNPDVVEEALSTPTTGTEPSGAPDSYGNVGVLQGKDLAIAEKNMGEYKEWADRMQIKGREEDPRYSDVRAHSEAAYAKRKADNNRTWSEFFTGSQEDKLKKLDKKIATYEESLTLSEGSAKRMGAERTLPKLYEQREKLLATAITTSSAKSTLGEDNNIPEPELIIADSEKLKEQFLKELEGGANAEQIAALQESRTKKILEKYNVENMADLFSQTKMTIQDKRSVGLTLARRIAITEGRRLGTTNIKDIAETGATAYTAIWGQIMHNDPTLTPDKLHTQQLALANYELNVTRFEDDFKNSMLGRSQKYSENLGEIKEYLFTNEEGESVKTPNSPTKGDNNAKIRKKVGVMAADAKRALQSINAGRGTPDDWDAIESYKDAVVFLAKVHAYKNRDVGLWTRITEFLTGEPEMGEADIDAQGSYFRIENVGENLELDFGNQQYFTRADMRHLVGDGSSNVFYSILTDERVTKNLEQRAQERSQ